MARVPVEFYGGEKIQVRWAWLDKDCREVLRKWRPNCPQAMLVELECREGATLTMVVFVDHQRLEEKFYVSRGKLKPLPKPQLRVKL